MNLENIFNFDRYGIVYSLKDIVKSNISKINNIDEFLKYFLKDFKYVKEFKELDEEVLYANLMASKTISQLAWNAYQNNSLYENCHINAQYLEKINIVMSNRDLCDKLKSDKKSLENFLIEMLNKYITIFCILYYKETNNLMNKSCFYCDSDVIGDICTVCQGNSFVFKDHNGDSKTYDSPRRTDIFNEMKSLDCPSSDTNPDDCLKSIAHLIKSDGNDESNFNLNISDYKGKVTNEPFIELKNKSSSKIVVHSDLSGKTISSVNDLSSDKNLDTHAYLTKECIQKLNSSENISNSSIDSDLTIKQEAHKESCWECSFCSYNKNEESNPNCSVCLNNKHSQKQPVNNSNDKIDTVNKSVNMTEDNMFIEKKSFINEESPDKWICGECSFRNDKADIICSMCYANSPDENISDALWNSWNCIKCKMKNPFDRYRCLQCGELAGFFDKWVCEQCCFFNDKLEKTCNVCGHINSHLIICKKCSIKSVYKQDNEFCVLCENSLKRNQTGKDLSIMDNNDDRSDSTAGSSRNEKDENYLQKQINVKWAPKMSRGNNNNNLSHYKWYCVNEKCSAINFFKAEYCSKCFVKNEPRSSEYFFIILKNDKEMKLCCRCDETYLQNCPNCAQIKQTAL